MEAGQERQCKTRKLGGELDLRLADEPSAIDRGAGNKTTLKAHSEEQIVATTSVSSRPWSLPGMGWRAFAAVVGGLVLRLWMLSAFPQTEGDALIYGNIARNILLHGQFALTDGSGVIHPTLIRLPGYPLFLAACFGIFGVDNYRVISWFQIALELGACLMLADFVRRIGTSRAGLNTLWLAAMCPFTAVYSSAPLTESLTFDMICLALWSLERYLGPVADRALSDKPNSRTLVIPTPVIHGKSGMFFAVRGKFLAIFTVAISGAAMLRPDGAILAVALWPALVFCRSKNLATALRWAIICGFISVLPFAIWGWRNWHIFRVVEPLAPRYANDPGEDAHLGWQHWVKTWCVDFSCTEEVYWNVPDGQLDINALPPRAFDSLYQRRQTEALAAVYNENQEMTPELDRRFELLAEERSTAHPIRSHLLLPLARLADMTLRPRVENLTIDLRWWQYYLHRSETRFSWAYAIVNLAFIILGIFGLCLKPRFWVYLSAYLLLRSFLLLTIEAPETRYTLEFFPVLFIGGGIALQRIFSRRLKGSGTSSFEVRYQD